MLVLLFVALWLILRGDLLYVFQCVILFLCFSVLLVLRLPRLEKRELILVLFVRLFGLCLFRFVGFLFLLGSGKGCGLWLWHSLDFSLTFFVNIVKSEMDDKLNSKRIRLRNNVTSNKKRRFQKQWWTDELSREWNDLCVAEKNWRNETGRRKSELKTIYVSARTHFDQSVQWTKRQVWFKMQADIDTMEKTHSRDFWKTIGKIGVGNERRNRG